MGIVDAVVDYAEAVERSLGDPSPRQELQLAILRLMPLYAEVKNLASWEQALQTASRDVHGEFDIDPLIEAVFEFGRCNLYCAFDVDNANHAHDALLALFRAHGVTANREHDVSGW